MNNKPIRISEMDLRKCMIDASRQTLTDVIEAPNKYYGCPPSDKTKYARGSFIPREEKEIRKFSYSLVDICLSNTSGTHDSRTNTLPVIC